jgi:hypothetical protein
MNAEELESLIKKTKEPQVLILSLNLPIPLMFAVHVYFVTIENNRINRYDVLYQKNNKNSYLYKNAGKPFQAFRYIRCFKKRSKNIHFIKHITDSNAKKLIHVLENKEYPSKNKYFIFPGPNSNTYAQWIINQVPKLKVKLPMLAFGKNFKLK